MLFTQISVISIIILLCVSEGAQLEDGDTIIVEAARHPEPENQVDPRQNKQFIGQFGQWPAAGWPFGMPGANNQFLQIQQQQKQHLEQLLKQKQQQQKLPPIQQTETCKTSGGVQGNCISLRECYPVLRIIGDNQNETLVNPGLAEALSAASGPCENHGYQNKDAVQQQNISVCCSNHKVPSKPTKLVPKPVLATASPTKPPNYRPPFFGHRPPASEVSTSTPPSFVPSNCGVGHITGGSETQPSKYPWIIAILNGQKQICGGSLIDNNHVLTAAHCVAHMNPYDVAKLRILLGGHNLYQISSGAVVKKVSRLVKHRLFSHRTLHNDIAILKLDSPVAFTDRIRPICLATEPKVRYENQVAIVAGWGSVGEHLPQPQSLREVSIDIWTNERCKIKYGNLAPGGIMDHMMCAGSHDSQRDACRGDSGGPLMIQTDNVYKQIGLVSWGIGCGRFPGVYTRINHFLDWIEKNRH